MKKNNLMQYVADDNEKELIKKASERIGLSVSSFGRSSAIKEARRILENQEAIKQ